MTDMTRDELKELRARAIDPGPWAVIDAGLSNANMKRLRNVSLDKAEAIMKAEADAGLAVVPCIPTNEMVKSGIAGAKTAGYSVHPDAAHFVLNAGNKAGNILGEK